MLVERLQNLLKRELNRLSQAPWFPVIFLLPLSILLVAKPPLFFIPPLILMVPPILVTPQDFIVPRHYSPFILQVCSAEVVAQP